VNPSVRVVLILTGLVVAGFALGLMLEDLLQRSDTTAPTTGALMGLGLGTAVAAVTTRT
jgi:hypothetical protein